MAITHLHKHIIVIMLLLSVSGAVTSAPAASRQLRKTWKHYDLLDSETQSSLANTEKFFESLYQLPSEFSRSSKSKKRQVATKWLNDLQSNNSETVCAAAAYLGILKVNKAAEHLEAIIRTHKHGGRVHWISIRSLGQIGNKESIKLLINLINDQTNRETRTYAKASLAAITGVYYGDDIKKWKSLISKTTQQASVEKHPVEKSDKKLYFSLPDIYGRILKSDDYANTPVLIMSGACWCGGCQKDAEPLRKFVAEYAGKDLAVIRTISGENELAAFNFQKHYKLPFIQLLDTDRKFEKSYNRDGWTFLMLADRCGQIIYTTNNPRESNWNEIREILKPILAESDKKQPVYRNGIPYMPDTLRRSGEMDKAKIRERFPSIAAGPAGMLYMVFTSDHGESDDIYMRVYDGKSWSEDIPVATTDADEYDATVIVHPKGHALICWSSNATGRYESWLSSFEFGKRPSRPRRITRSSDGTMHPRMACDDMGRLWVTYSKWHKMQGISRDQEVYVRMRTNGKWSPELRVSPQDVPDYEDHCEPTIVTRNNSAIICWNWDFHQPEGYTKQGEMPTVFMQEVISNSSGKLQLRHKKPLIVSGNEIDVMPAMAFDNKGSLWCAWDSQCRNYTKSLCLGDGDAILAQRPQNHLQLGKSLKNVCTPAFAAKENAPLTLFWSETQNGQLWQLRRSVLDSNSRQWSQAETIVTENNPRFCSAAYDSNGQIWIACSSETDGGRKIKILNSSDMNLSVLTSTNTGYASGTINNSELVKKLRRVIDENYSYRDFRGIDWDKLFAQYSKILNTARTPRDFAEAAAKMLSNAKDMHLWLRHDGDSVPVFRRSVHRNYNLDYLKTIIQNWENTSKYVSTGQLPDGIGYILIKSWKKDPKQVLEPALDAVRRLSHNRAMIIDVRPNGGGSETYAKQIAGCFIDKTAVYAKHVYRNADSESGWRDIMCRNLEPNRKMPYYAGKIAVLTGQANASSCEAFLLMMKQIPNCRLIGETSYGSSGNPKAHDIGNGITVYLPSWKALRPDGTCFEGEGIHPDIDIKATGQQLQKDDPVLNAAKTYLSAK